MPESSQNRVLNEMLYACGGMGSDEGYLNVVECFEPRAGRWRVVAPLLNGRQYHASAVLDGAIYIAGGRGKAGTAAVPQHGLAEVLDLRLQNAPRPRYSGLRYRGL